MKKHLRLISFALILCSVLCLFSGCMSANSMTVIKVGVPWAEGTPQYENIKLAVEDSNMFTEESDFVKLELVTIPEDEAGKISFLKDVGRDTIGMFFYERDELVDKYIEDGTLATLADIQKKYPSCFERRKQFVLDTSTDSDGVNHMLALCGNYQGVFFNEEIFLKNGLTIPKTWDQFTACINKLKAAGITPIAGGFADSGMQYWIDELILMEGGVAEHSYVPKFGVVNSWARAIEDFKGLYNDGVFNSDCMTKTNEQAVAMFKNGEAAMILGNSKTVVGDNSDVDNLGVFALPLKSTGKKNIGDIICDFDMGVYINSQFLKKREEVVDTMVKFVTEYLDAEVDSYYDPPEAPEWSYKAYKSDWTLPANPYAISEEIIIDSRDYIQADGTILVPEEKDPSEPEEIIKEDGLDMRVFNMMENVTDAGRSMTTELKTFDYFIDLVKKYLSDGGDVEALLTDATQKEVAEQNGEDAK